MLPYLNRSYWSQSVVFRAASSCFKTETRRRTTNHQALAAVWSSLIRQISDQTPRNKTDYKLQYDLCWLFLFLMLKLLFSIMLHQAETWNLPLNGTDSVRSPWKSDCDGKNCELTFRCFLEFSELSVYIFLNNLIPHPTSCFFFYFTHYIIQIVKQIIVTKMQVRCTSLCLVKRVLACLVFLLEECWAHMWSFECWERMKSPELLSFKEEEVQNQGILFCLPLRKTSFLYQTWQSGIHDTLSSSRFLLFSFFRCL